MVVAAGGNSYVRLHARETVAGSASRVLDRKPCRAGRHGPQSSCTGIQHDTKRVEYTTDEDQRIVIPPTWSRSPSAVLSVGVTALGPVLPPASSSLSASQ